MPYFSTVTAQGTISIPIALRKKFGLHPAQKVLVQAESDKITIQPPKDLLALRGALSHVAKKKKSIQHTIQAEQAAVREAVAERYGRAV